MTTQGDLAAILQGVLDAPDDDLPRLAYADALEETGRLAHAEFIRLGIERPLEVRVVNYMPHGCFRYRGLSNDMYDLPTCPEWSSGIHIRRGFVEIVTVEDIPQFMERGAAFVRQHPVVEVRQRYGAMVGITGHIAAFVREYRIIQVATCDSALAAQEWNEFTLGEKFSIACLHTFGGESRMWAAVEYIRKQKGQQSSRPV